MFPQNTIKLKAANEIFKDLKFEVIELNFQTVGYKTVFRGATLENSSLTKLCAELWQLAIAD